MAENKVEKINIQKFNNAVDEMQKDVEKMTNIKDTYQVLMQSAKDIDVCRIKIENSADNSEKQFKDFENTKNSIQKTLKDNKEKIEELDSVTKKILNDGLDNIEKNMNRRMDLFEEKLKMKINVIMILSFICTIASIVACTMVK